MLELNNIRDTNMRLAFWQRKIRELESHVGTSEAPNVTGELASRDGQQVAMTELEKQASLQSHVAIAVQDNGSAILTHHSLRKAWIRKLMHDYMRDNFQSREMALLCS